VLLRVGESTKVEIERTFIWRSDPDEIADLILTVNRRGPDPRSRIKDRPCAVWKAWERRRPMNYAITAWKSVVRSVWALGLVSMFMDISSEMIHALLPINLVTVLGTSTLTVGLPRESKISWA
jgi:hypothetical protein